MSLAYTPTNTGNAVTYKTIDVDGIEIAYREAGKATNPKLVLLHGWPASSHQYRELIPALSSRFHVIAPDYPGFGNSGTPDPDTFAYTFDNIAAIVERFLAQKGFDRFGLYVQDYGGPVGFRIMTKDSTMIEWLVIQNTNAYEAGFSEAWGGLRNALWLERNEKTERDVESLLELGTVKAVYLTGSAVPELLSPDSWNSDYLLTLQRKNGRRIQMDLFYDYRTNPALYPKWQKLLKERQPKTIIFWAQGDLFFTPEGGELFLNDLPNAEMHRLAAGHFATEDCLDYIAGAILRFHERTTNKGDR
jgi:pimeloyl-ACP methyl ester carboxylesterase